MLTGTVMLTLFNNYCNRRARMCSWLGAELSVRDWFPFWFAVVTLVFLLHQIFLLGLSPAITTWSMGPRDMCLWSLRAQCALQSCSLKIPEFSLTLPSSP